MFYYSINSRQKVVHCEGCHHLKTIRHENLQSFDTAEDVYNSGYRLCICCSPIIRELREEKSIIREYCQENGVMYFIDEGNLSIWTYMSRWKVLVSSGHHGIVLYHKNTYESGKESPVPGYHRQKVCPETIPELLKYIIRHDSYRQGHPLNVRVKKTPAAKGTKRWAKEQKAIKRKKRKMAVWNVISLIDSISDTCMAQA